MQITLSCHAIIRQSVAEVYLIDTVVSLGAVSLRYSDIPLNFFTSLKYFKKNLKRTKFPVIFH